MRILSRVSFLLFITHIGMNYTLFGVSQSYDLTAFSDLHKVIQVNNATNNQTAFLNP